MKKPKITVVGAGNVGATTAFLLLCRGLGDVVLVDLMHEVAMGKALDMRHSLPIMLNKCKITGTGNYAETANSDVAIITAGFPRKEGMSREELLEKNRRVVGEVSKNIALYSPDAILLVVTNPVDVMCSVAIEASGFPKKRVVGMSGILDSARFRSFAAEVLGVPLKSVDGFVLGAHNKTMVPVVSRAKIAGKKLGRVASPAQVAEIVEKTRNAGAGIIKLMGASAYYSTAMAIAEMVGSIALNQKKILPCSALLEGEYGINGCFLGVPAKLGSHGVMGIAEVRLSESERRQFADSAEKVKETIVQMEKTHSGGGDK